ncbi:hypothetical protein PENTCL1PPCAC_17870, partial [Pristionchus entomophagus]
EEEIKASAIEEIKHVESVEEEIRHVKSVEVEIKASAIDEIKHVESVEEEIKASAIEEIKHVESVDSSHCTLHLETTVSSPVLLVKGSMETHHVSDDVILIRQFDHAPSPIKDIHLLTSAIDPSIEAALTLTEWKEAETYSSFSSEEGMFEEYWEEVVVQHYEEEIRRTQEKRLQLLKRIEDTRRINERTFERRYSYGERRSYDRISMDSPFSLRTIDSPYSFNS